MQLSDRMKETEKLSKWVESKLSESEADERPPSTSKSNRVKTIIEPANKSDSAPIKKRRLSSNRNLVDDDTQVVSNVEERAQHNSAIEVIDDGSIGEESAIPSEDIINIGKKLQATPSGDESKGGISSKKTRKEPINKQVTSIDSD